MQFTETPVHGNSDDLELQPDEMFGEESGYAGGEGARRQRTLRDYLNWLFRWAWVAALTTVGGAALGAYVYVRTPETYVSQATIEIERQELGKRLDENDAEVRLTGQALVDTIAQKFKLPKFHRIVAEDHELHLHPEILPEKFSFFGKKVTPDSDAVRKLSPGQLSFMMPAWVKTESRKGSNLLQIKVQHTSRKITAILANGLIDAYQKDTEEEVLNASKDTVRRVGEAMDGLRDEIGMLSKRSARYSECLKTKVLIDAADLEIARMATRYGPKWDPFIEVRKRREQLGEKFLDELEVVKSGDEEERAYWESPDRAGADPVHELKSRVTLLDDAMAAAKKGLADMQATQTQALIDGTDAREFSVQRPAGGGRRIGPNKMMTLGKFTGGGMVLGVGIVMLLGLLDPSARTVSELESLFGLRVLGAIPRGKEKGRSRRARRRAVPVIATGHSPQAEAVRNLRAGLSFLGSGSGRRSFMLTSSLPREGKSWVSANLAASFGAQGDETLVLDLDLRKPAQHRIFGLDRSPGATDFITGEVSFEEIVRETEFENVRVVTAGRGASAASELLTSKNVEKLMASIPESVERIVVDTPPALAIWDALAAAKLVDSTIVVYKVARTPVKALERLLGILRENGTRPTGLVANGLPHRKQPRFNDYYYGYHGAGGAYGEIARDR